MNEVEEIKSRLDIVEVISGYIPLKQAGRNFKGLSPFKSEKTPSFMVSPEKNIWHDFSSGKGGDVFSFVMEIEGISFIEALEMLARKAGVNLKPRSKNLTIRQNRTRLYEANDQAMRYFFICLAKSKEAKSYLLQKRKLSQKVIRDFCLGYAPDSWNSLTKYLANKGFNEDELISAGLVSRNNRNNSIYDIFRARIVFPIFDMQQRVIGFSGRILVADSTKKETAKYINTPQTEIYNKSLAIYGIAQAKEAIRVSDRVVIVEGNMDVVALHDAGFKNTVACSGTALTGQQLKILSRLTKNIIICFDSDEAGILATQRAIEIMPEDIKLEIISLAHAKDPDELLKKGKKYWQQALKSAKYAPDYLIEYAKNKYDVHTAPGKKSFVRFLLPLLRNFKDEIEQQHYVKKIAQIVESSETSIQKLINQPIKSQFAQFSVNADQVNLKNQRKQLSRLEKLEQELLELVLSFSPARPALADLDLNFCSSLHRPIFSLLNKNQQVSVESIAKELPKYSNYVKILSLRGEQNFADITVHDKKLEAYTQVQRINQIHKQQQKRQLARQLAEAEAAGKINQAKQLLKQYQLLLNED